MIKKNKIYIFLIITVILIAGGFFLIKSKNQKHYQVCFKNNCFEVEIANTPEKREKGLMFREALKENEGMFFIFEKEGNYPFWMKNTLIPLDIIWLSENGEIVFIKENAQPCTESYCPSIVPNKEAKYVLEIKAGISKNINLNVGEKAKIKVPHFLLQ